MAAILVMAVGMATFTTPLAAVTMGALGESDQGVASAFNYDFGAQAGDGYEPPFAFTDTIHSVTYLR